MRRLALVGLVAIAGCGLDAGPARTHDLVYPGADVILISIDTLRADGLGCYGNPHGTSPNLDRIAAEGILFEEMYAVAPTTATSHATMFTGFAPAVHQASNMGSKEHGAAALDERFTTLAERFKEAGYQTAAYTDGGLMGAPWQLLQGFDQTWTMTYDIAVRAGDALTFLDRRQHERPVFLFVHTYQVHQPYLPPADLEQRFCDPEYRGPLRQRVRKLRNTLPSLRDLNARAMLDGLTDLDEDDERYLRALYDAEVAHTDEHLGRLFDGLRESGLLERTVLIVTSDHGEEFDEHGGHGHREVFRETLHVPFLVRLPDGAHAGARVRGPVSGLDVAATVLDAAGLPPIEGGDGASLLGTIAGADASGRVVHSQTVDHMHASGVGGGWRQAVRVDGRTLLREGRRGVERERLYDSAADPGEQAPIWTWPDEEDGPDAHTAAELRDRVEAWGVRQERLRGELLRDTGESGAAPLDDAELQMLEDMGYAGGG